MQQTPCNRHAFCLQHLGYSRPTSHMLYSWGQSRVSTAHRASLVYMLHMVPVPDPLYVLTPTHGAGLWMWSRPAPDPAWHAVCIPDWPHVLYAACTSSSLHTLYSLRSMHNQDLNAAYQSETHRLHCRPHFGLCGLYLWHPWSNKTSISDPGICYYR